MTDESRKYGNKNGTIGSCLQINRDALSEELPLMTKEESIKALPSTIMKKSRLEWLPFEIRRAHPQDERITHMLALQEERIAHMIDMHEASLALRLSLSYKFSYKITDIYKACKPKDLSSIQWAVDQSLISCSKCIIRNEEREKKCGYSGSCCLFNCCLGTAAVFKLDVTIHSGEEEKDNKKKIVYMAAYGRSNPAAAEVEVFGSRILEDINAAAEYAERLYYSNAVALRFGSSKWERLCTQVFYSDDLTQLPLVFMMEEEENDDP